MELAEILKMVDELKDEMIEDIENTTSFIEGEAEKGNAEAQTVVESGKTKELVTESIKREIKAII